MGMPKPAGRRAKERNDRMLQATGLNLLLLVLFASSHAAQAQVSPLTAAENFVDDMEDWVKTLAASVLQNYGNREVSWKTCAAEAQCSKFACRPPKHEPLECLALPGNDVCDALCKNVSMSQSSYIWLPPKMMSRNQVTCDGQNTICAQRRLDQQAFEGIYTVDGGRFFDKIAWSYFGASNGVFRIYPGVERKPANCSGWTYDPRKRPWYRATMAVSKEVIVLLDTGPLMASTLSLSAGNNVQVFDAAQEMVTEFLDTLYVDDLVSVYSFNNAGAELLLKKVGISAIEEQTKKTLDPLKKAINAMTVSSNVPKANLTSALDTVLNRGSGGFETTTTQNLKVLLIITGGDLVDLEKNEAAIQSLNKTVTEKQVKTFIFHLSSSNSSSNSESPADSSVPNLQAVACALGGSYNEIARDHILEDPLSTLVSFYSYVADLRFRLDGKKPLWVASYPDSASNISVLTVSLPVFDEENGLLVGVAGIDLLTDEIKRTWGYTIDDFRDPPTNIANSGERGDLDCRVGLVPEPPSSCSGGSTAIGLCLDSPYVFKDPLQAEDFVERTCCDGEGACGLYSNEDSFFDKNSNKAAVIGSVVGAFILLLLLFLFCCRKRRESLQSKTMSNPSPVLAGGLTAGTTTGSPNSPLLNPSSPNIGTPVETTPDRRKTEDDDKSSPRDPQSDVNGYFDTPL